MLSQRLKMKSVLNILVNTCNYCSENQAKVEKKNWRTPAQDRPGEWFSSLSVFQGHKAPSTDYLTLMQTEIDLRPSAIKKWWQSVKERKAIFEERYIPERHGILGGDLAAAHFIVHRGGAVRFFGNDNWVRQDENEEYDLPKFYDPEYCIEAIDVSKLTFHFEGLGNLLGMHRIKWLSLEGCPNIDDWCVDRISGAYGDCLEYLDLRNCPKVTARGLTALYRLRKLEKLLVSNDAGDKSFELTCLMLEDIIPKLKIEGIVYKPLLGSTENLEKDYSESKKKLQ